jgi:hypothetical protein
MGSLPQWTTSNAGQNPARGLVLAQALLELLEGLDEPLLA